MLNINRYYKMLTCKRLILVGMIEPFHQKVLAVSRLADQGYSADLNYPDKTNKT